MSHETPTVNAKTRDRVGSRYAKRLRAAGRLPAVIYGHKSNPVAVHLDEKETLGLLHHGTHVLNVAIEGGATETCLVKELQFGYLGDNLVHLDLTRVDLDEVVELRVHLHFVGTPEAAKKPGAIITHDIPELAVRCKVRDIPESIRVDLTEMGTTLTAGQIHLPAGITLDETPDAIVARVETVLETATGEAAAVEATAVAPEVITERKKDAEAGAE